MTLKLDCRSLSPIINYFYYKEKKLSQKEAAKLLGLTEAAISQYQHSKRGNEVVFSKEVIEEIRKSADKILLDKNSRQKLIGEIYRISELTNVRQIVCDIHRSKSKDLENCNVCFDAAELIQIKG